MFSEISITSERKHVTTSVININDAKSQLKVVMTKTEITNKNFLEIIEPRHINQFNDD